MSNTSVAELKAESVVYYSQDDESTFFEWLKKISCVTHFGEVGRVLTIQIELRLLDQYNFREILALFHRYNINKKQLISLDRPEFYPWFHDSGKYWYEEIFGTKQT